MPINMFDINKFFSLVYPSFKLVFNKKNKFFLMVLFFSICSSFISIYAHTLFNTEKDKLLVQRLMNDYVNLGVDLEKNPFKCDLLTLEKRAKAKNLLLEIQAVAETVKDNKSYLHFIEKARGINVFDYCDTR